MKIQNHSLSELQDRSNKLTSELIMTQDTLNKDRKYFDLTLEKSKKDLHNLDFTLKNVNHENFIINSERNEIINSNR